MPIEVHETDVDDLRWFFCEWYRGEMGERSTFGGMICIIQNGGAQTHGRSRCISEAQAAASARLRGIGAKLGRCTLDQIGVLGHAFGPRSPAGLEVYGTFPLAVLACVEAEAYRAAESGSPGTLEHYLGALAETAQQRGGGKQKEEAERRVVHLRTAAEKLLLQALLAYGAQVEGLEVPQTVSVSQIASAVHMDRDNVKAHLRALQVPMRRQRDGRTFRIPIHKLQTKWPVAAAQIFKQLAALHTLNNTTP